MNNPGGGFGPRGPGKPGDQYERVAPPSGLGDVPRFLKELLGGFFHRFAYIIQLVWRTGKWILFALSLIALFNGISPAIGALISKDILNELQITFSGTNTGLSDFIGSRIFYLLIFLFVYRFLKRIIGTVESFVTRVSGEKIVKQVKVQIMEKSKELDLSSFDQPAFYEKLENANREAGMRPIQILSQLFNIISTVIELVSYIVILCTAPDLWWAILVIVAVSVPSAVITFVYRRKNFRYVRYRSRDRREMNYYSDIVVNKNIVKEVRMFDLTDTFIGRYQDVFSNYYKGLLKLIKDESIWHTVIAILSCLVNFGLFFLIALQVFTGAIMLGDYTLYTGAITSIASCVSSLISNSATIYEGTLFIDNLIFFMKETPTIVPRAEIPEHVSRNTAHTVEFVNVCFRYPGSDHDVLHNINLRFRPGETVVLVGLNGAGKTTLIKLLTRLYDPTEGYILLDGKDLRDYDVKDLYSIFGIIFQDFGQYAVTIEENIHFGDIHKDVNREEIEEAARQSSAADFISRLPEGFDTPLMRYFEERGRELSIGQWQKLAVARAFYSESDILILDEPTASLDPMAEQDIFNQFDRLREDKTTIFVSHRLSSATVASLIVVLEYGCVIETGTHSELMQKKGRYYELFSTQARRYLESDDGKERFPEPEKEEKPVDGERRHRNQFPEA